VERPIRTDRQNMQQLLQPTPHILIADRKVPPCLPITPSKHLAQFSRSLHQNTSKLFRRSYVMSVPHEQAIDPAIPRDKPILIRFTEVFDEVLDLWLFCESE
jgi:hypothetical protein